MNLEWLKNWIEIFGGLAGLAVTLFVLNRYLKPVVKNIWGKISMPFTGYSKVIDQLQSISKVLESNACKMDKIVSEIRTNGGASIKDCLTRIEQRQLQADQRSKALISDLGVGVMETDASGSCIWVNRTYCRMSGRTPSEFLGKGWVNTIAPEDRKRVEEEWDNAISDRRELEIEYSVQSSNGNRIGVEAHSLQMVDLSGQTIGYFQVAQPTTDLGFTTASLS